LIRKLLARGLDPNRRYCLGKTILHACAEQGDRSTASICLDAGVDINPRELEFQGTPLAAAVRVCCETEEPERVQRLGQMVEFLLNRGAATNLPGEQPWATPLAWATRRGRDGLVELLKQHGAV
jgi:ankyrin repeat protein